MKDIVILNIFAQWYFGSVIWEFQETIFALFFYKDILIESGNFSWINGDKYRKTFLYLIEKIFGILIYFIFNTYFIFIPNIINMFDICDVNFMRNMKEKLVTRQLFYSFTYWSFGIIKFILFSFSMVCLL